MLNNQPLQVSMPSKQPKHKNIDLVVKTMIYLDKCYNNYNSVSALRKLTDETKKNDTSFENALLCHDYLLKEIDKLRKIIETHLRSDPASWESYQTIKGGK